MQRLAELQSIIDFKVEECSRCHAPFAMTKRLHDQRQHDKQSFWCPACGCSMSYTGADREYELRLAKQAQERAEQQAEEARSAARMERVRAAETKKQYLKIRNRVKKGMCPCCNETFPSLAQHMQKAHPEFGGPDLLRSLREAFGLTQAALGKEIGGIAAAAISQYETGKSVASYSKRMIESWLSNQVNA